MRLYEIEKELEQLLTQIEQEGEVSEETLQKLEGLQLAYNQKMEGIAKHVLNLKAEVLACEAESQRLKTRAMMASKKIDGYEKYLLYSCPEGGTFGNHKIKWRNSQAVKLLVPEDEVPPQYRRERVSYSVDRVGIAADLKSGATLPFAEMEQRKWLKVE